MGIFRKIGIGIVMFIPSFVGSGLVYSLFHGLIGGGAYIAVLIWLAVMAYVYKNIICEKSITI